jgi:putative two-component system response regulator
MVQADAKILIVDDQIPNIDLLERILIRAGYKQILSTSDPIKFISIFKEFNPDIILMDLHMPKLNGIDLLHATKEWMNESDYIPVLILTADISVESKRGALAAGAKDFISKPLDKTEVLLRINNLLETRMLHKRLKSQNLNLEQKVRERTLMLEKTQEESLELLAIATEYRDDETGKHTQRVGELSAKLAQRLGYDNNEVDLIRYAAPLHDVGKIGIPDSILLKPGKLTEEEFETIKKHTLIGKDILSKSQFPTFILASKICMTHHENWDGSGYPLQLKGDNIPMVGQIVSIVDMFDAMTHKRPYKEAWTIECAIEEIRKLSGTKFNPKIVEAFIEMIGPPSLYSEKIIFREDV